MYEQIIQFLALIGLATCFYLALELFNALYSGFSYLKELKEYKKELKKAKAQVYYFKNFKRGF